MAAMAGEAFCFSFLQATNTMTDANFCRSAKLLAMSLGMTAMGATAVLAQTPADLLTRKDKMSDSTGVMTARTLAKNGVPFDAELLVQGLRDGMAGGEIRIPEKELKVVLQSMQADILRKLSSERSVKASINRENGLIYQADYRKKPDVNVLPGNLMYRVIKDGTGDKPGDLSQVVVRRMRRQTVFARSSMSPGIRSDSFDGRGSVKLTRDGRVSPLSNLTRVGAGAGPRLPIMHNPSEVHKRADRKAACSHGFSKCAKTLVVDQCRSGTPPQNPADTRDHMRKLSRRKGPIRR